MPDLDYAAFARDLDAVRAEVEPAAAPLAHAHMRKQALVGRISTILGYATSWIAPNPISAGLIALGISTRWTIVAHHTSHRGLDRIDGVPAAETSKAFAKGMRRWVDWFDWLDPEAWDYEHNKLHHYHTGELADPDLVEEQLERVRVSTKPMWVKKLVIMMYAFTWKFTYYAPNIFVLSRRERRRKAEKRPIDLAAVHTDVDLFRAWMPFNEDGAAFWKAVALPYILLRFVAIPLLFLPISAWAAMSVAANTMMAELLTGLHTFIIVVPNHAGDDMHRFQHAPSDRAEFYVRQVLSSVNFRTGGAVNDFMHGFLNYQIEHHLWPDLPPLAYQMAAPKVREICARHGAPYIQEGVFSRVGKLLDIMVGNTSMIASQTLSKADREAAVASASVPAADQPWNTCDVTILPPLTTSTSATT